MANCHTCWWADYNPNAPGQHNLHEEPDYLQMSSAFGSPPMIRTVKSCGKDKSYFETFGAQEHDCKAYMPMSKGEAEQELLNKSLAKKWPGKTSRQRLPVTSNILMLLDPMTEGSSTAYNILMDAMAQGSDMGVLITNLNDMNIRGEQIVRAFKHCGRDIETFEGRVLSRSLRMVKAVNVHPDNVIERAVTKGADALGHSPYKPKAIEPLGGDVAVVDTGKKATVKHAPIRRLKRHAK
jgi:hypothetical protein